MTALTARGDEGGSGAPVPEPIPAVAPPDPVPIRRSRGRSAASDPRAPRSPLERRASSPPAAAGPLTYRAARRSPGRGGGGRPGRAAGGRARLGSRGRAVRADPVPAGRTGLHGRRRRLARSRVDRSARVPRPHRGLRRGPRAGPLGARHRAGGARRPLDGGPPGRRARGRATVARPRCDPHRPDHGRHVGLHEHRLPSRARRLRRARRRPCRGHRVDAAGPHRPPPGAQAGPAPAADRGRPRTPAVAPGRPARLDPAGQPERACARTHCVARTSRSRWCTATAICWCRSAAACRRPRGLAASSSWCTAPATPGCCGIPPRSRPSWRSSSTVDLATPSGGPRRPPVKPPMGARRTEPASWAVRRARSCWRWRQPRPSPGGRGPYDRARPPRFRWTRTKPAVAHELSQGKQPAGC